ncbi:MAG TPA: beta-L-arabinofuranosidase domain-containing protein [Fimbriimonadaceae bacterium]|nr:beta-L-arabinofuranosidase domain-containing protein [Fimbriimonadaceae bacterium]
MPFRRRMRRIPLSDIRLTDNFWMERQKALRETTIEAEYRQLVETGRLRNFEIAAGKAEGDFTGLYFNDSDVYKWCEAAAYALATGKSKSIEHILDEVVELIAAAQEPDGYLDTFFQIRHPNLKWRNLLAMHEMYCAGHLFEAGVALFEANGDRRLLNVAIRLADHIMSIFGPDKRCGYCGHEEIELGLLRLADTTGEAKYREFARWMIEQRGGQPSVLGAELDDREAMTISPWLESFLRKKGVYQGEYCQDHAPIREHTEVVGHAVRAMYLYIAASEFADGDPALESAIEQVWHNLTRKRMYVTGGIGPSSSNEGFTGDYDLPNLSAYAETCAACGLAFWGRHLAETTGASEYADIVERAIYNGAMSGISLSGDRFFYTNPLESRGTHQRVPWFECACCPPNIARLIGSMGWYVASVSDDAFWIHIPAGFDATATINGVKVSISCLSDYPWSGKFTIAVNPEHPVDFELRLRIPDWADEVDTELPGLQEQSAWDQGYAVFSKRWHKGDTLRVDLGMEPKWMECHPLVRDNLGRVALTRGPLVYCAEEHDLGFAPQLFVADTEAPLTTQHEELLGGVVTITAEGFADDEAFVDDLYAPEGSLGTRDAVARFIPYFSWCNRGPNSMQVWVRRA